MFSDSFFAGCKSSSSQPEVQTHSVKSPLATLEEWKALEGVTEWPCPDPSEEEDALNPGSLLGSQDEIERYMERSAREFMIKNHAIWTRPYIKPS